MTEDQADALFNETLREAAGDRSALLALVHVCLRDLGVPSRESLTGAEVFARLAASDGSAVGRSTLAAVLLARSNELMADDFDRSEAIWAESALLMFDLAKEGDELAASSLMRGLSVRADAGDEESALVLNDLVDALPPATLAAARQAMAAVVAA